MEGGIYLKEHVAEGVEVVKEKKPLSKKQLAALAKGREKAAVSPNRGRPAKFKDMVNKCHELTPYALSRLERIIRGSDKVTVSDQIKAIKLVFEYGFGKPTQRIEVESNNNVVVVGLGFLNGLSANEGQNEDQLPEKEDQNNAVTIDV